jgi:hypothetical protein
MRKRGIAQSLIRYRSLSPRVTNITEELGGGLDFGLTGDLCDLFRSTCHLPGLEME